jgi:hypothetical protein
MARALHAEPCCCEVQYSMAHCKNVGKAVCKGHFVLLTRGKHGVQLVLWVCSCLAFHEHSSSIP